MRKRTVTTIEMHEIAVVRRLAGATLAWCTACLREVEMVSLEEAALLAGVSLRDICRRVGADHLHFVETSDGGLVCTSSLLEDGELNSDGAEVLSLPASDLSDTADQ